MIHQLKNSSWLIHLDPQIVEDVFKINLSINSIIDDKLIWIRFANYGLSFKHACNYTKRDYIDLSWTKFIWHLYIFPTKSLVTWSLMHNVITIEDNLIRRGMHMVSSCYIYNHDVETLRHLFLRCMYTLIFWHWIK